MRWFASAVIWLTLCWGTVQAQERPALAVVVVVDQLRGDYLAVYRNHFGREGFRRLMDEGAWFSQAYLPYGATATGPGHATIATGTVPAVHGIVANDWIDEQAGQKGCYCCQDEAAGWVGRETNSPGRSPRQLLAPTVADALKAATGRKAKVWAVALKDRSAILPAGQHPDGAVWWDSGTGKLITSTYYGSQLPAWAAELNKARFADRFFHQKWELLLPREAYAVRLTAGSAPPREELAARFRGGEFPKVLGEGEDTPGRKYYGALYASPLANELMIEAAQKIILAENMGADEIPDLLLLGFSANDAVGHLYGPDSIEVMDCTLRTDRQIAALLNWLDEHVGKERYVFALSADHGVAPLPEYTVELGLGGGRFESKKLRSTFEEKLAERFGDAPKGKGYVRELNLPWLYFDRATLEAVGTTVAEAARFAADVGREIPGIAAAYPADEVTQPDFGAGDELRQAMHNSAHPGRSGHVYLHWARYWYKGGNQAGHGAAHDYDQHVPILLAGPGVRRGEYHERVSPTGMAATLCALLKIDPPKTADPPLRQALRVRPRP